MSRKVQFSISTGYVGCRKEEVFYLEDLGIDESDYETKEELESTIDEAYQEWLWDNIDSNWWFKE